MWYASDSCCPSVSHKVAHAESVPQSDARAGWLRFNVVYSASVILDSDTHLVRIHFECMLCRPLHDRTVCLICVSYYNLFVKTD